MKPYEAGDKMYKITKEAIDSMNNHINEVVDYAINMHASPLHNKQQVISIVVTQFIYEQLSALDLDSIIHDPQFTYGIDGIDMNVILENLGETGIRIGAFAYVLATKLEAILLEDSSTVQDVVAVETLGPNEYRLVDAVPVKSGFKLSFCYRRYIEQDQFVADTFIDEDEF